ncbi:cytochrome C oxidase subunit III [Pseudarthrobacter sulfonivorans]|uniref:Cytochrome aa3 subunit 3 n=2 Tax=Pseudarthrobacter sulfonivorans TaxID=121292 RepID=A0A0U3QUD5_9MICC|nr:cytochrome C oxidase subunit III [Pseudarthrobacter sulfonivorans]
MTTVSQPVAEGRQIPGESGVWVFFFGDMVIFLIFFVAYLVHRAGAPELFAQSSQELGLAMGVANTLVLLSSSLLVVLGLGAVRREGRSVAVGAFRGAMACGVLFVVLKAFEYTHIASGTTGLDLNAFFSWYFVLTGVHLVHVLIGLGVLGLMVSRARQSGDGAEKRMMVIESGACFWHLVDLLWMLIFPLLYLVA